MPSVNSVVKMLLGMLLMMMVLQATAANSSPVVDAPWGRVQGTIVPGDGSRKMNGYLGIPYARPPVGDLRFERPQPNPGPRKGTTFLGDTAAPICMQRDDLMLGKERPQSEDCLKLDIYTPTTPAATLRPVMFFIHGGAFYMGDSPFYRPSKLVVDGDLVVVVIQYRLGAFGFLTTSDGVLSPNLGLWDQTLALQWVHDNIAAFGGDPDTVTIFGESAGSMSVGLHTLSPKSKGLFKRAILQSGSPVGFVLNRGLIDSNIFFNLSKSLGCDGDSTQQRVACLKKLPAKDLNSKAIQIAVTLPLGVVGLPVIDGDYIPADPKVVLQDDKLLAQTSLPTIETIIGFNNQEGSLAFYTKLFSNVSDEAFRSPEYFRQLSMMCLRLFGLHPNKVMTKAVEFAYLGAEAGEKVVDTQGLANLDGDCILTAGILDWALMLAASPKTGPRYLYVLEHDFEFNLGTPLHGSHHGDDISLLFDLALTTSPGNIMANKTRLGEHEKHLSKMFTKLFTSFARTGKPEVTPPGDVEWPIFTSDKQQFLSISKTPKVVDNLGRYKTRWALWAKYLPELSKAVKELQGQDQGQDASDAGHEKEEL